MYKNWCRLCAVDNNSKMLLINQNNHILTQINKYLNIQIQDDEYPDCICPDCCNLLSDFDIFRVKCEKVQELFHSIINEKHQSDEIYKAMRESYLFQTNNEEKKFVPPINFKGENKTSEPNNENSNKVSSIRISRKRKKILKPDYSELDNSVMEISVKAELDSDDDNNIDTGTFFNMENLSDSDEDYNIPLANVTDISRKIQKKKGKKLKSSKSDKVKKKDSKRDRKQIINTLIEDVSIKEEPTSDTENFNSDLNIVKAEKDKKIKKEKKINPLSFLKYDCHICGVDTKNWNALCIHFRDVHNARAKIMCCCGKFLASRVSIGRHSAKHGKTTSSFECPKCDKRFPRDSELKTHMISHLPKEEYPFVCCKCARRFTTQQLLRHHEKKHIPMEERLTYPCEKCQSKFASKSSLMMHMKAVHERLKPFVCDQCGRAFTTKGILEEHQVRHSDARPHVCNVCHKSFKTKQRLAIHSDTHNDTVYQCPHCPIRLNSRRTLRMHLFVHDEVCRYQCNFCEKAFKRAKDLKNHSNLHTGRRPYSCPWCSRTFANGSNCRAHKRRMHPNELRMSDASAALVNKVPVPTEEVEDKQVGENGEPKVIYTTVKRKLPNTSTVKTPNFVFQPDASDKEFKGDFKSDVMQISKDIKETKAEKKSPEHNNYESSMSPLNLNMTATNKQSESSLTITPVTQNENVINDFQTVTENYNAILQSRILEQTFNAADFKDNQDGVFNKNTPLYANFGGNLYNIATTTAQFVASNPYGINFTRDDGN